jgi:hypothetical protein
MINTFIAFSCGSRARGPIGGQRRLSTLRKLLLLRIYPGRDGVGSVLGAKGFAQAQLPLAMSMSEVVRNNPGVCFSAAMPP